MKKDRKVKCPVCGAEYDCRSRREARYQEYLIEQWLKELREAQEGS